MDHDLEAISPKEYLKRFNLDYYLSEALCHCESPEHLQHFFQEVLDGSRLKASNLQFRMVIATPENRRAFVELMRRQLSLAVPNSESVAMTILDFYDMVVLLLPDFPLDLIIEASHFVPRIDDGKSHRLIGQPSPGIAAELVNREVMFCMQSLQRMVEFRLVYGEVLKELGSHYRCLESSNRFDLVRSLRSASLACRPSEGAWQRLLCGDGSILSCKQQRLTFLEAVHEMADCFELVPAPIPEGLILETEQPEAKAAASPELAEPETPEIGFKAERSRDRRSSGPWRLAERGSMLRSRSRA